MTCEPAFPMVLIGRGYFILSKYLSFYAGPRAMDFIQQQGLHPDHVKWVAGAAGGPKCLILTHLDGFLFGQWFKNRQDPLFLMGSSAGAWRFAAACQRYPVAAMATFREAYINQWYGTAPCLDDIDRECQRLLNGFLPEDAIEGILNHPCFRLNFISAKAKGFGCSEHSLVQGTALAGAALMNAVKRDYLKYFFQRILFHHPGPLPPLGDMTAFDTCTVPLTRDNFRPALLSSGSIPLVMSGVEDISGAHPGVYRDGGVVDYHQDLPFASPLNDAFPGNIVLFPHYTNRIIPGWLDKKLFWRTPNAQNMANVLLVVPTRKFLDLLPGKQIPERGDFVRYKGKNLQRIARWSLACKQSQVLVAEFHETVASGKIKTCLLPIASL